MAKKYIVDISVYPYSYDVEAENQEDAEEKAKKLFFEEVNGRSIYEIETTEELSQFPVCGSLNALRLLLQGASSGTVCGGRRCAVYK